MDSSGMVFVAAPTPFTSNGEVDLDALRHNIARWIAAGVEGVLVLGSTGEAVHLEDAEAEQVVAAAREAVPPSKLLLVGTGRATTAATVRWTARTAELGADLALVLTPFYYRKETTSEALAGHFRSVADDAGVPILLYSMPAITGVTIASKLAGELGRHPKIFGIKDSSGDTTAIFETIVLSPPDFRVFNGSARSVFPALSVGSAGSILAVASVAPEIAVAAHRAFAAGDLKAARRAAVTLARLAVRLSPYGLGGLKAAMSARGYRGGVCRPPLAFDRSARPHIEAALAEAELGERS